jgi:type IV pilus assembly protein PilA
MTSAPSRGFTLVEIMTVIVIIGLLATMAWPAFKKVRNTSINNAVMNNARQMAVAADRYFFENGVTTVLSGSLVGSTNYVRALITVALETYPSGYTQSVVITVAGVDGSRTITYAP